MKLQEADAKTLLVAQGLPVPDWAVAHTAAEARAAADRFLSQGSGKVVIKAQVLVGGRGKAGGVKLAGSPEEAAAVADHILGMDIKGMTVRKVLVGPAADIVKEFYLAALVDRAERRILLMGSAEGGVEIEHVAETNPDAIVRRHADPQLGLLDFQARELVVRHGPRRSPQGGRRDRQGPRADDDGLRRRSRRDQSPGDRSRAGRTNPVTPRSSDWSASTRRSRSTTRR